MKRDTAKSKIINPGKIDGHNIFAKIELSHDGRLSISGVIGPKRNGDAHGSCGQFIMGFKEYDRRGYSTLADVTCADGWTAEMLKQFFDAWDAWHLNDMRAGCEHQRKDPFYSPQDIALPVAEVVWDARRQLERDYEKDTRGMFGRPPSAADMKKPPAIDERYSVVAGILTALDSLGLETFRKKSYDVDALERAKRRVPQFAKFIEQGGLKLSTEHKNTGWLRAEEHPLGFLGKPCSVCGYKYGSAWRHEEVPADVLKFLFSLPDTAVQPAWV